VGKLLIFSFYHFIIGDVQELLI